MTSLQEVEAIDWEPDQVGTFRSAQLLLLLEQCEEAGRVIASIDRLGYYDFFSANPFIVTSDEYPNRERDRIRLKHAGFLEGQLSYGQAGQRFVSRRVRLRTDLSFLLSRTLISVSADRYALTVSGRVLAAQLSTVYADQYRASVRIVAGRLGPLTNSRLENTVQRWLGKSWLLTDFLGDADDRSFEIGMGAGDNA